MKFVGFLTSAFGTPVWEGRVVRGVVVHTLSRGRHVWADGDLRAEPGWGRYLPRQPFGAVYQGGV